MGFSDGVKAFVEPAIKLLDIVSNGVGAVYEPTKIRRLADARAYEIKTISEVTRSNIDMPIVYNPENGIVIDTSNFKGLTERAVERFKFHEIIKQQNIESVISKAYLELENSEKVPNDPVEQDWILRFFNAVGEVSSEQMQVIWAKVLSGEVKKPGTFSFRTLERIKNLSPYEAQLFQEMSQYFTTHGDNGYSWLYDNENLHDKYKIEDDYIMILVDCGLMLAHSSDISEVQLKKNQPKRVFTTNSSACVAITNSEAGETIEIPCCFLTTTGEELLKITRATENRAFIMDVVDSLPADTRSKNVRYELHDIKRE
ncbi:MAG: DUF2806 domain-containing protein [Defluviitaleaceae bacterium]|nr:DUF2806 domain-containing protein [Defluviitaleaceae bacterium]